MKNNKRYGILLGAALLGVGTAATFSEAVAAPRDRDTKEARKEVKEARKEVRQERKDVRKADDRREREQERRELRDAREELRDARQDLRRERRDDRRDDRRDNHWDNRRNDNRRYEYGSNRPSWSGGWNNNWNNNNNWSNNNNRTLEGVVVNDWKGDGFYLRTTNNQTVRVVLRNNEPSHIDNGDRVRVYGYFSGNTFYASSLNTLYNR